MFHSLGRLPLPVSMRGLRSASVSGPLEQLSFAVRHLIHWNRQSLKNGDESLHQSIFFAVAALAFT